MNISVVLSPIRIGLVGAFLAHITESAATAGSETNPYQAIVERNVFGLKPLPPPQPAGPERPPPPKITLTGITTILGDKRVLMKVQMPAKPGESPREQSFILVEGDQEGDIQVLAVNEKTGDVTLNDFGAIVTLNLEKDGAKLSGNEPPGLRRPFGRVPSTPPLANMSVIHAPSAP